MWGLSGRARASGQDRLQAASLPDMPDQHAPPCRPCQVAGIPQSNRVACERCSEHYCRRHLHRGQVNRQWAVAGARLSFTYGHHCVPPLLRPWAERCDRGHDLMLPNAIVLGVDEHRRCRACHVRAKQAFYEREKAEAARAGMGIKAWKLRRAAERTGAGRLMRP